MKIRNMVLCALFAATMALCAWIAIPFGNVVFTMQSFAVFLALLTLGGGQGSAAILVYLCLGAVGLPVFSGFYGYLYGFLLRNPVLSRLWMAGDILIDQRFFIGFKSFKLFFLLIYD